MSGGGQGSSDQGASSLGAFGFNAAGGANSAPTQSYGGFGGQQNYGGFGQQGMGYGGFGQGYGGFGGFQTPYAQQQSYGGFQTPYAQQQSYGGFQTPYAPQQSFYSPSTGAQGAGYIQGTGAPTINQPAATPAEPTYGTFNNLSAKDLQNYVSGLKSASGINNTWTYDDTTGLYVNPLTGAYSNGNPSSTFQLDQANAQNLASYMQQYGVSARSEEHTSELQSH